MTPVTFPLKAHEIELRRWKISFRGFMLRTFVLFLTTLICLSPLIVFTSPLGFLLGCIVLTLTYMWVCDDFRIWRDNRTTLWMLSSQALHIYGPDAPDPVELRLPLQDIRHINRWPFWSLVVTINKGTALTLPLTPFPRMVRTEILAARDALLKVQS